MNGLVNKVNEVNLVPGFDRIDKVDRELNSPVDKVNEVNLVPPNLAYPDTAVNSSVLLF